VNIFLIPLLGYFVRITKNIYWIISYFFQHIYLHSLLLLNKREFSYLAILCLTFQVKSVSKFFWFCLQIVQNSDLFLLPPMLPLWLEWASSPMWVMRGHEWSSCFCSWPSLTCISTQQPKWLSRVHIISSPVYMHPWLSISKSPTHCHHLQDLKQYTTLCLTCLTSNYMPSPLWPHFYSWNIHLCFLSG
jgi:hypothetical protein